VDPPSDKPYHSEQRDTADSAAQWEEVADHGDHQVVDKYWARKTKSLGVS
jgi:hypothetical protein